MRVSLSFVLPLVLGFQAFALADGTFEQASERWSEVENEPALSIRLGGLVGLASCEDRRGIALLGRRYKRPGKPKEFERYLIAQICGDFVRTGILADDLWAWAREHRRHEDAWLWYQSFRVFARANRHAEVWAYLRDPLTASWLGAAALAALARENPETSLRFVPEVAAIARERREHYAALLLEGAAELLYAARKSLKTQPFRKAALALLKELEDDRYKERTRLVVARRFARLLDSEDISLDPGYWRRRLQARLVERKPGETYELGPRFFGISATGRRIAYLIDFSDSMLTPLTPEELTELRRVITGKSGKRQLPWTKITNRLDVAREELKASLRELRPGMYFTVVGFGDSARFLRSTCGLVEFSSKRLAAVERELDSIRPKKHNQRPLGSLWGGTNLHDAFLVAFRLHGTGLVKKYGHVDRKCFQTGCDTLFLLSDGVPTVSAFGGSSVGMVTGGGYDPETGRKLPEMKRPTLGRVAVAGPYVWHRYLSGDVERLNLFRKAEMHAVTIGMREPALQWVAEAGLGTHRQIGTGN